MSLDDDSLSLDDLLLDKTIKKSLKKTKRTKKDKDQTKIAEKPFIPVSTYETKSVEKEKPNLIQILGLDPIDLLITYPDFDKWFREIAPKMPYFPSYVKQANQYGKDADIKSHYFAVIAYFHYILNGKV